MPVKWRPVLLRGLIISGSMILYFGSLGFISVPEAAAGLFTSPVWILLISALGLRQKIGPRRIAAVALGFGGALVVLNPFSASLSWALVMPVAAGLFWALGNIATRAWCEDETALTLLAAFFVSMVFWGAGGIAILTFLDIQAPDGPEGLLLRAWGAFTPDATIWFTAQIFVSVFAIYGLTRAYQLAEASYVGVFEYSFLVSAALWGALLLRDPPTIREMLGLSMILVSGLLIASSPAARKIVH